MVVSRLIESEDSYYTFSIMSYRHIITTNEEFNDEKLPLTSQLNPISTFDIECNENIALIEEHERLTTSISALTHHVAHVQFHLQQIISAPTSEDRENLLSELNNFTSNGIPDVMCQTSMYINEQLIEGEKSREKELIYELKHKLDELEHYALASGSLEGVPTSIKIEKQRVLIDQLCQKLNLQVDETSVSKLSTEELRKLVDQAFYQLTNPVKHKTNLITQMHTQITDLENFIEFLKVDSANTSVPSNPIPQSQCTQSCLPSEHNSLNLPQFIKKSLILIKLYTLLLLSCGTRSIENNSNQSKNLISKNHFGDIRAQLEIVIDKVFQTMHANTSNDVEEINANFTAMNICIRRDFVSTLRALLEHGLYEKNYSTNLPIWNCLSMKNESKVHIWKLFLKYYDIKQGEDFINSPARKLSQSFSLNIVGNKPITIKECLLTSIDTVVKLHEKNIKQMDSCFKSFICYALNEKKLVAFLRLILKTDSLVENYYHSWSYIKQSGFNDALHSLDRLTSIDFHLPIDTSIRRFKNNEDLIE